MRDENTPGIQNSILRKLLLLRVDVKRWSFISMNIWNITNPLYAMYSAYIYLYIYIWKKNPILINHPNRLMNSVFQANCHMVLLFRPLEWNIISFRNNLICIAIQVSSCTNVEIRIPHRWIRGFATDSPCQILLRGPRFSSTLIQFDPIFGKLVFYNSHLGDMT